MILVQSIPQTSILFSMDQLCSASIQCEQRNTENSDSIVTEAEERVCFVRWKFSGRSHIGLGD